MPLIYEQLHFIEGIEALCAARKQAIHASEKLCRGTNAGIKVGSATSTV
jgi:hypothetical protein